MRPSEGTAHHAPRCPTAFPVCLHIFDGRGPFPCDMINNRKPDKHDKSTPRGMKKDHPRKDDLFHGTHGRIRMHRLPCAKRQTIEVFAGVRTGSCTGPRPVRELFESSARDEKDHPKGMIFFMAPTGGFEPLACRLGGGRSILLSYVGKSQAYIFYSRTEAMST